jgi:protein O-GlcNAc transferase
MPQLTVQQAFDLALRHHQAGRFRDAEELYQQILRANPDFTDAMHNLGVLALQLNRTDVAAVLFRRTIKLNPSLPEVHSNLGNVLMSDGKLDEAMDSYRRAIELRPDYVDALSNLGAALQSKGEFAESISIHNRILHLKPDHPESLYNLATALHHTKKIDQAIAAYRNVLAIKPNYAEARNNLGAALCEKGELQEAIAQCRLATELDPKSPMHWRNLGTALDARGSFAEAAECFGRAVAIHSNWSEAHFDFGKALQKIGRVDEAIAAFTSCIALKPDDDEACNSLGLALMESGQLDEAIASYRQAVALKPDNAAYHNNLGSALGMAGNVDEAIAEYRLAVSINQNFALALCNLAGAYKDSGNVDEAIHYYQRALAVRPDFAETHSNLIYARYFHSSSSEKDIAEECRRWNQQHALPLKDLIQPHLNDRDPTRQLRIGYVSADFREHVVGHNLMPILRQHARQAFEVTCYSQVSHPDAMTGRFRRSADRWRDIANLSDAQAVDQIRQDQIDVLVDLAVHTAGNRLRVFARKPAPVQVTYLGYCGTTGMGAMDYRFSDHFLDPPGTDLSVYSEKTIFLTPSYWCYRPMQNAPDPSPPPSLANGYITFGCLNNFAKVSQPALLLWAAILRRVPGSRLLMQAHVGSHRQKTIDLLHGAGIESNRIEFVAAQRYFDYLQTYSRIDLALDPFPFAGGITSCDSLWMGVPLVTLPGRRSAVGRGGFSILGNVGLDEFAARNEDEYVTTAVRLAADLPRLTTLRQTLRHVMKNSPLMDAVNVTHRMEAAYRKMWQDWCRQDSNAK